MKTFDLIIIGAGAAGLFCASVAAQRGASVALVDHSERLAEKIRISGGGRCNFTNLEAYRPERFVCADPRFARAALQAYRPQRFIDLLRGHGVGFHEKHRGQLFCDDGSERIIRMLAEECEAGAVHWFRPCAVSQVRRLDAEGTARFALDTDAGSLVCRALVIATGGLSIPKIGATDFAYRVARQFGLRLVPTRPGLVPLTFEPSAWEPLAALAGLSLEVRICALRDGAKADGDGAVGSGSSGAGNGAAAASARFQEDMLFTHRGLSGPAILQISNYWRDGDMLDIDLAGGIDVEGVLLAAKSSGRPMLGTAVGELLPRRLAQHWLAQSAFAAEAPRRIAEMPNRRIAQLAASIRGWRVRPTGTEGYRKAEVTLGGIDSAELEPASLQCRRVPGLYFVGEAVDVTGWLGGYNFQWAWASGYGAAMSATVAT